MLDGVSLLDLPPRERARMRGRRVAMIFQDPMSSLNPVLRVGEAVAQVIRSHEGVDARTAHARVIAMLETVGIRDAADRAQAYPHEFSGGMRQRIMIAMALAANPSLLLADEPTTALDVIVQAGILRLVDRLRRKGSMGLLFVSHDLAVVAQMCNRIAVMYAGQIVEEGPAEAVLARPRMPYSIGLMESVPGPDRRRRLPAIPGLPPGPGELGRGVRLHAALSDGERDLPGGRCRAGRGRPGSSRPLRQDPRGHAGREWSRPRRPSRTQIVRPMSSDVILEARGLWKTYEAPSSTGRPKGGARPALIDASITLRRGEVLGVVGESGSGKTTLARCLALLERPDAGTVILDGEDLTALSPRVLRQRRRRVQTVFQDPYASLNPRIRVGDAIAEVLRVHRLVPRGGIDARVGRLIDLVGLPRAAVGRFPAEFSGGQRQRICIARALAAEPDILIADEPVSALDVSVRAQILNLLLDLRDEFGLSIMFIGHDLFVVDFVGDRIAVMLGGQVIEILPAAGRLSAALHPYSRELIAAAPTIAAHGASDAEMPEAQIGGAPPAIGCPYVHRCPYRSDPRCDTEYPRLAPVGDGHYVASFCDLARTAIAAAPTGN